MLGVLIFAIGVMALGRCVDNCLVAETIRADDQRARRALENRVAQIEAKEVSLLTPTTDKLTGMFAGMTLKQSHRPLKAKNEKNAELTGLYEVSLEVNWMSDGQPQAKKLSFYVLQAE